MWRSSLVSQFTIPTGGTLATPNFYGPLRSPMWFVTKFSVVTLLTHVGRGVFLRVQPRHALYPKEAGPNQRRKCFGPPILLFTYIIG